MGSLFVYKRTVGTGEIDDQELIRFLTHNDRRMSFGNELVVQPYLGLVGKPNNRFFSHEVEPCAKIFAVDDNETGTGAIGSI